MYSLSVPGKTFLCGEYLALRGGPSLVLATEPRFRLKISKLSSADFSADSSANLSLAEVQHPFHPQSPAGLYIAKFADAYRGYQLRFENPYNQGGFGGSTAEYLLVKAMHQFGAGLFTEHQLDLDVRQALSDYQALHADAELKPSGADLVGQSCGWITAFDRRSGRIQIFSWPFAHLGFVLFKTGLKIATHEHLKTLTEPEFFEKLELLNEPCQKVWDAFAKVSEGQFLIGMNEVTRQLEDLGLQDNDVKAKTQRLRRVPGIRVAKGCGALGADVALLVFDRREIRRQEVIEAAQREGLVAVATEQNLSAGIEKDPLVTKKEFDL